MVTPYMSGRTESKNQTIKHSSPAFSISVLWLKVWWKKQYVPQNVSFVPSLVDIEELRNVRGLQADRQTNEHTDG